jgi:hypothetical protein
MCSSAFNSADTAAQLQAAMLCGGPGVLLTFAACFLSLAASAFSFIYFLGAMIAA